METQNTLQKFVSQELLNNGHQVQPEENLLMDGMIDSIGMLRLVTFIEEEYRLKIPYEDLTIENFRSIKVILEYLQSRKTEISVVE